MAQNGRDKELKPIKKLPNGSVLYSNYTVRGPICRLSFVSFVTPKINEGDDGKKRESYGCAALFKKGENLTLLKESCRLFALQEKGANGKKYKPPFREQDDKTDEYEGFVNGAYYFNTSSKYPPKCIGRNKEEIELSSFYSGCWARLLFRPYIYDKLGNRGIGLGLAGAQFIRDDEPLGGGGYAPESWTDDEGDEIEDTDGQYGGDEYEEAKPASAKKPAGKRNPSSEFL